MALKVDPFTPSAPIDDPARFSGRDTELGSIVDALFQTAHGNPHHVAITGARGIGKTSALHRAHTRLAYRRGSKPYKDELSGPWLAEDDDEMAAYSRGLEAQPPPWENPQPEQRPVS